MKKIYLILIVCLFAFLFTACSSDEDVVEDDDPKTDQQITQTVDNNNKTDANTDQGKTENAGGTGDKEGTGNKDESGNKEESDNPATYGDGTGEADIPGKSISLSVNNTSGEMKVSRKALDKSTKAGLPDGWTIFVYLCGTDLESDYGAATYDLDEMLSASSSDKVKFIVETGGTYMWNNDVLDTEKLQRYLIRNGDIKLLDERKLDDMGDPGTLSDFLKWGLKEHASKHNGLIFWDHGGGSITGICFDELYDNDSLDLTEVDSALNESLSEMDMKLDFIGFDACLMGTVETANILATYAGYMYGSEELEPGSGWDYTAIG
ncbi:MAG: hypothetical protein J5824_10310, partial [Lachnospiraceae bacterium]|nr:hypothetical protein [Lachnospiraceae bacterium]